MLDRYSLEKLIDAHGTEALKRAARDRLASRAAGARPKIRRAWPFAARLRALASSGLRPFEAAAGQQREGWRPG
jgi:hypothetical protein